MDAFQIKRAHLRLGCLTEQQVRGIGQVTSLDIFQNNTRNFAENGLFSTEIFGKVGSEERLTRMGIIDTKTRILHPRIFKYLTMLKQMYKGILSGKVYAKFDEKEKDFVLADQLSGETGYYFFLKHWEKIKFKRTSSSLRDAKIENTEKYKDKALIRFIPVYPAGLRDLEVDINGGTDQHEINDFYRAILRTAGTLGSISDLDSPIIDKARYSLQISINELHDYLLNVAIKGKGSFAAAKFGRRKIRHGTRNVMVAVSTGVKHLDDPNNFGPNQTQISLYQSMKASLPLMIHYLNKVYLSRIFNESSAWLVDPKTMQRKEVRLSPKTVDKWMTSEGIAKLINNFENIELRNNVIKVEGCYLGLVYRNENHVRLMFEIDEIPADKADLKPYVYPLTYGELFYLIGNNYLGGLPVDNTRYPIEAEGSIYPSYNYVMTTSGASEVTIVDEMFEPTKMVLPQYPNLETNVWHDAVGPHPTRVPDMGGDYDGDQINNNICLSNEAIEETKHYLDSMNAHIDPNNKMIATPLTDIPVRVIFNLTSR